VYTPLLIAAPTLTLVGFDFGGRPDPGGVILAFLPPSSPVLEPVDDTDFSGTRGNWILSLSKI